MKTLRSFSFAIAALLSTPALAATDDVVILGGSVSSSLQLSVNPTGSATALALDGDAAGVRQIVMVADLGISTNNEQGFTLTASSGSISKSGGSDIPFQVTSVEDEAEAPAEEGFTVASGASYTFNHANAGSVARDLYIMYTPATLQDPGAYSGTISLSVSDN